MNLDGKLLPTCRSLLGEKSFGGFSEKSEFIHHISDSVDLGDRI